MVSIGSDHVCERLCASGVRGAGQKLKHGQCFVLCDLDERC